MAKVIKNKPPLTIEESEDIYEALLSSIVSQQLSGKAAKTIYGRFLQLFPESYPHPDLLLQLESAKLREVGLSQQKAQYVQNVAAYFNNPEVKKVTWPEWSDDKILQELTSIKGVGKWTVQMILMFPLNRPDVLPHDDLGIQKGFIQLYGLSETGKALRSRMDEIAEPWKPYRTYGCRYLWKSLEI